MIQAMRTLGCLGLALALVGCELDADPVKKPEKKAEKPEATKPATPRPPTYKVEKGPFKIEVALKGIFEAEQMAEVTLNNLEAWTPQTGGQLIVKKVVEHGATVRKGEPIVWLDLEKIERAIRDLEAEQRLSVLAIQLAEKELPVYEKSAPLELATAERAKKIADEDLKTFLDEDRAWTEKSVNYMVKRYQQYLEYSKEELRQLQKMYKAKDLTEETEEIILKRQRYQVELMEFEVKLVEQERAQLFKTGLPRREQRLQDSALKTSLDLEKARATLPLLVNQKQLALARQKYEHEKSTTRLAKLQHDRASMTVKAPADGLVYHGKCVRGQWPTGGGMDRLQPGAMLQGTEVLLTVVQARPLFVRAVVEEKELRHLHAGLNGKIVPTANPDLKLPSKVEKVSAVPVVPGSFEARLSFDPGRDGANLMPGMACSVKLVPYQNEDALTVPASAVFADELDDDKHFVYVPGKDGKAEKRPITIGKKTDRKVEIREGLTEGDEILREKPDDSKKGETRKEAMTSRLLLTMTLVLMEPGWFGATSHSDTPTAAVSPPKPRPVEPLATKDVDAALQRGIAFLLRDQNEDGSWGTPGRTKDLNIYAPVPGAHHAFRSAVTALCVSALIEAGGEGPDVRKSIERGETWLIDNLPTLRRATADVLYNVWGHSYGIEALVRMYRRVPRDAARQRKLELLIREQISYLARYESVDGGWGYYDFRVGSQRPATNSTSFQTAAVLVALHEAKEIGIEPPKPMLQRAIDSIHRQQKSDFTYLYGEYLKWEPMHPINRPGGSLGRSQCCNVGLRLWQDAKITDQVLTIWLDRLFARNGWLDMGRKRPIPHESHFAVAGYFFYYGHYYAALCFEQLKPEQRKPYQDQLARVLIPLQEEDGSWWDFPLYNYHQQYGTAFALMSLKHCRR